MDVNVVLKGYLKYKAKGAWPKNWKDLWFILRQKSDGSKNLEYYDNEKKSLGANAVPKGVIDLSNVMLIQRLPEPDKKSQFIMNFSEGVPYRYFDAPSAYNMEEWVTSLNSIIFSKVIGDVVFSVDLHKSEAIPFHGPCNLTLDDEAITIQNRVNPSRPEQHQVQWNIAHVKKFWIKSDVRQLIISVGRQSSTGPGEFVFTTAQNVQIMHGITAMLNEAKRKHGLNMPLTAPASIETHTIERPISSDRSRSAKVTGTSSKMVHQKSSTLQPAHSNYNKLNSLTLSQDSGYSLLHHHDEMEKRSSVVSQPYDSLEQSVGSHVSLKMSPATSPSANRRSSRQSSYSSLHAVGDHEHDEVYEYPLDLPEDGSYERLSHSSSKVSVSSRDFPAEEYGKLDHHKSRPPELPQRKLSSQPNEFGKLPHINEGQALGMPVQQSEYGRLDHSSRTPELSPREISQQNEYGKLQHLRGGQSLSTPVQQSEYGRLNHSSRAPELPPRETSPQQDEYGKLQHSHGGQSSDEALLQSEYGRLDYSSRTPELPQGTTASLENEYGKLDHSRASVTPVSLQQGEYGKLSYSNQAPELPKRNYKPEVSPRKSLEGIGSQVTGEASTRKESVPTGYETFKRVHGYSISSSVSSYCSDGADLPAEIGDKRFSASDESNDGDYSQLNRINADDIDPSLRAPQSSRYTSVATNFPAPPKPKPYVKPRNV